VHLDGEHAPGDFVRVRIVGAHPHHLDGEPVRGGRGAQGASERERASVAPRVGPEPAAVA
jgi:hypothetical protein